MARLQQRTDTFLRLLRDDPDCEFPCFMLVMRSTMDRDQNLTGQSPAPPHKFGILVQDRVSTMVLLSPEGSAPAAHIVEAASDHAARHACTCLGSFPMAAPRAWPRSSRNTKWGMPDTRYSRFSPVQALLSTFSMTKLSLSACLLLHLHTVLCELRVCTGSRNRAVIAEGRCKAKIWVRGGICEQQPRSLAHEHDPCKQVLLQMSQQA